MLWMKQEEDLGMLRIRYGLLLSLIILLSIPTVPCELLTALRGRVKQYNVNVLFFEFSDGVILSGHWSRERRTEGFKWDGWRGTMFYPLDFSLIKFQNTSWFTIC